MHPNLFRRYKFIFLFLVPGDFKRDIIYSDDLARGLMHVVAHGTWEGTPQNSAAVWNVGLQTAYGMNQMMAMIMQAVGKGSEKNIRPGPYPDGFPGYTLGANRKLKGLEGQKGEKWQPLSDNFQRSLETIFFLNAEYYDRLVRMSEKQNDAQVVDLQKLEEIGFEEMVSGVWQKGIFTLLLDQQGSLEGLYMEREQVGPADIEYYGES